MMTSPQRRISHLILALVVCQCGLHACMAGMRLALPLNALSVGASKLSLGILVSCFAIFPALAALRFGAYTDRVGPRGPALLAAGLSLAGVICAWWSSSSIELMCLAAGLCGTGSGLGMIAVQRAASRETMSREERLKVFSTVALAPALGSLIGPIVMGRVIDGWGYGNAYFTLMLFPLASIVLAWLATSGASAVSSVGKEGAKPDGALSSLSLLKSGALRQVMVLNLLVVASWDLHGFALPILGHEKAFSATEIGSIFAAYGAATLAVRLVLPFVTRFFTHPFLPVIAMLVLALIFASYPLLPLSWLMMLASAAFGMVVGIIQPTIMVLLHDAVPSERHGQALALRSMCNQTAIAVLPLMYGLFGVYAGVNTMFWLMAILLFGGVITAIRLSSRKTITVESLARG